MTNRALPNPFPWAAEYQYAQSLLTDGELVFTAGQGGFGDDGTVVSDDPEAQIRQAFANVNLALQAGGASLETIVKMTVFLSDGMLVEIEAVGRVAEPRI